MSLSETRTPLSSPGYSEAERDGTDSCLPHGVSSRTSPHAHTRKQRGQTQRSVHPCRWGGGTKQGVSFKVMRVTKWVHGKQKGFNESLSASDILSSALVRCLRRPEKREKGFNEKGRNTKLCLVRILFGSLQLKNKPTILKTPTQLTNNSLDKPVICAFASPHTLL